MDTENTTAATTAEPDFNVVIGVAHSALAEGQDDRSITVDASGIPAAARLDLLKSAIKLFVTNRVNVANVRQNKLIAPFAAYDAAVAADPLQTAVAKPEGERPAPLDTYGKAEEAVAALLKGEIRSQMPKGEGRTRAPKDPLVAAVTPIVVRAVYEANKTTTVPDGKGGSRRYTFPDATKAVGGDGVAYLNASIDAKVAAAPTAEQAKLRSDLEKQRDTRYIEPARIMIGAKVSKASSDLPSIL